MGKMSECSLHRECMFEWSFTHPIELSESEVHSEISQFPLQNTQWVELQIHSTHEYHVPNATKWMGMWMSMRMMMTMTMICVFFGAYRIPPSHSLSSKKAWIFRSLILTQVVPTACMYTFVCGRFKRKCLRIELHIRYNQLQTSLFSFYYCCWSTALLLIVVALMLLLPLRLLAMALLWAPMLQMLMSVLCVWTLSWCHSYTTIHSVHTQTKQTHTGVCRCCCCCCCTYTLRVCMDKCHSFDGPSCVFLLNGRIAMLFSIAQNG